MTLKNKLKSLRAEYDLDQQDMADILSISRTTYCNKETGKSKFNIYEAKQIAELFNSSIDDIFFTDKVNLENTFIVYPAREVENS